MSNFGIGCYPRQFERVGRSGLPASTWREFGEDIGKKMRNFKKKGKCKACIFYKSKPCEQKRIKSCQLTPEEFIEKCPNR